VPNATIRRDALVARLDTASECPLSLVVAAPGSGKTALLVQWVDGLDAPVAWMSCDQTDADAIGFWRNVAMAVGLAWTDAGLTAAELADSDSDDEIAVGIANQLVALDQPGAIVIDDFHLAASDQAVMKAFVSALPPRVRLVLGSRHDPPFPVGRLRLQGRMLELRQAELRFVDAEARQLLAQLGVEVSDAQLGQIIEITEGWAAAVHLAGLWLQAHNDPDGLLHGLGETDRSLVDFLMNEVIELQPPDIVEFLTVTAELETFDARLCDAVRDRDDSAEMLRRADAANLFLVEADPASGWHRYHTLFGQFLRGRLRAVAPERATVVHRAAAEAYSQRGELMAAVDHSMQAGDTEAALAQLEAYATRTWSLEDQTAGAATALAWLQEHGAVHLERSPESVLACTVMLNAIGRGGDAEPWLRQVDALEPNLDHDTRFMLHGAWSFDRLQHGDPVAALDRARHAQAVLDEGPVGTPWVEALPYVLVQAQVWLDDLDGADATLESARGEPVQSLVASQVRLPGLASQVQVVCGELADAEHLATSAIAAADRLGLADTNLGRAEPHLALAAVALERDELDEAETHADQVMRIVESRRRPPLEVLAHLQLAQIASTRADDQAAADAIARARAVLPHAARPVVAHIDHVEARLALDRGDQQTATALAARVPRSPAAALLAARVQLAAENPVAALEILLGTIGGAGPTRRLEIEHGLLSARAVRVAGAADPHEPLLRTLELAEPVGFRRSIVAEGPAMWELLASLPADGRIGDYVADLLDSAHRVVPAPGPATDEGLVDPLSDRERTVLRYLASRLTCTEIARELYLSVNTVRSHVKAVYRKLGVSSRAEAVDRGRTLGAT
jgi:LuxR family maltose regulon positive regulatory protein